MCADFSRPDPAAPEAARAPRREADPSRASIGEPPRPRFLRRRRAEAAAALVPLFALFALMPPFIGVFVHDGRTLGAPSILIFLLAVWAGLIAATRRLARGLVDRDGEL